MLEPDCFLRYRISAATRNFTSGKSHWRRAATGSRGFKMVLFTEPSEDLCRRKMRSTECPSGLLWIGITVTARREISVLLCAYKLCAAEAIMLSLCPDVRANIGIYFTSHEY